MDATLVKDFVTCCFDVVFMYFAWSDIKHLYRDRCVSGIDYRSRFLYVAWGIWVTVVVYADAGLVVAKWLNVVWTLQSAVWLGMALLFKRQDKSAVRPAPIHEAIQE